MAIRFRTRTDFGRALEAEINKATKPITDAAVAALGDAAKLAVRDGRANIRSAGRFHGGWITGLRSRVYKNRGLDAAALIYHRMARAGIFEEGGIIRGKPLLWIPLGGRRAVMRAARNVSSINLPGRRPLLVGDIQGERKPIAFGLDVARIRKRFSIAAIVKRAANKLGEFYHQRIKGAL